MEEGGVGMQDNSLKRPPFRRRVETDMLVERLEALKENESVSYDTLSELIGEDVRVKARHILRSARGILMRDYGVNTEPVTGEGVIRTDGIGTLAAAEGELQLITRRATRVKLKVGCASYEKLDEDQRTRFTMIASVANVVASVTRKKALMKLEAACRPESGKELPIQATLALFMGK